MRTLVVLGLLSWSPWAGAAEDAAALLAQVEAVHAAMSADAAAPTSRSVRTFVRNEDGLPRLEALVEQIRATDDAESAAGASYYLGEIKLRGSLAACPFQSDEDVICEDWEPIFQAGLADLKAITGDQQEWHAKARALLKSSPTTLIPANTPLPVAEPEAGPAVAAVSSAADELRALVEAERLAKVQKAAEDAAAREELRQLIASEQATEPIPPQPGTQWTNPSGHTMVWVDPGTFVMGQEGDDGRAAPAHRVQMNERYLIGLREVSQELWTSVMGSNPTDSCAAPIYAKKPSNPVSCTTWMEAVLFANALSKHEGRKPVYRIEPSVCGDDCDPQVTWLRGKSINGYRLPTEAEWEHAARSGKGAGMIGPDAEWVWEWEYTYSDTDAMDPVGPGGVNSRYGALEHLVRGQFCVADWCQPDEAIYMRQVRGQTEKSRLSAETVRLVLVEP